MLRAGGRRLDEQSCLLELKFETLKVVSRVLQKSTCIISEKCCITSLRIGSKCNIGNQLKLDELLLTFIDGLAIQQPVLASLALAVQLCSKNLLMKNLLEGATPTYGDPCHFHSRQPDCTIDVPNMCVTMTKRSYIGKSTIGSRHKTSSQETHSRLGKYRDKDGR